MNKDTPTIFETLVSEISASSKLSDQTVAHSAPPPTPKRESPARTLTRKISMLLNITKQMKVLPPIETSSIILIRFTSSATPELIRLVKERLQEARIIIVEEEVDSSGNTMFGVSTTHQELELEAEHLNLIKPCKLQNLSESMELFRGTVIMEQFEVASREAFRVENNERESSEVYDRSGIFNSSDRVMIVNSLLESMAVLVPGHRSSFLATKLNEGLKFPPSEIDARFHKLYLLDTLRKLDLVDDVTPIHSNHLKNNICTQTLDPTSTIPIEALRDYYGAEVAFYFAWMKFYIRALLFPGISGLIIFVVRLYRQKTIDDDSFTPFHGLFTFLWAIAFTQFWSREEKRLAYRWGTYNAEGRKHDHLTVRHEFVGTMRISEVTKMNEKYFPPIKRKLRYCFSALVTLLLLAGAFFVMILSLNMQGYIKHRHDSKSWHTKVEEDGHHPFHFRFFASLSEKGSIFDSSCMINSTLAVVLHVALVLSMNMGYRKIAEMLTDFENHESQVTYNNSLIFKRFFFEAFDAYLVLMYLAFYEQDVNKVRSELINVFNVDTFRRLLLEGVIPFVTTKIRLRSNVQSNRDVKKFDLVDDKEKESLMQADVNKEEYEEFDDYIEMIIQLGYICLFASAYPLAPFVAILANVIELRLDAFKITHVYRRPLSVPVDGIEIWGFLIKCIVWLSAITNCMIFCFSSMQMVQYLPEYFIIDSDGEHELKSGSGWVVVFIVFGIERVLLVLGILLCLAIPTIPEDVDVKIQQKEYIQMRIHHVDRSKKNAKKDD